MALFAIDNKALAGLLEEAGHDVELRAAPDTVLHGVTDWSAFAGQGLAFYAYPDPAPLKKWTGSGQGLIICSSRLADTLEAGPFLLADDPRLAFVHAARLFLPKLKPGIHPSAVVHPKAELGQGVSIGPLCVIGAAEIADGVSIGPLCSVGDPVRLGKEAVVLNGAHLGDDGLGSLVEPGGGQVLFPHFGRLIVGERVVVGTASVLCRGALSDTVIGAHTHISASCTIGHNSRVGEVVFMAPGVHLGGGARIGERSFLSMGSAVRDGVELAARTTLGMNATVRKSQLEPGCSLVGPEAKNVGAFFQRGQGVENEPGRDQADSMGCA